MTAECPLFFSPRRVSLSGCSTFCPRSFMSPVIHRVSQINPMRSMALFTMLDETRIDGLGTDAGGLTDAAKGRPEGTP
jgi:hypothetical protein